MGKRAAATGNEIAKTYITVCRVRLFVATYLLCEAVLVATTYTDGTSKKLKTKFKSGRHGGRGRPDATDVDRDDRQIVATRVIVSNACFGRRKRVLS